jgi:hypothetical protein
MLPGTPATPAHTPTPTPAPGPGAGRGALAPPMVALGAMALGVMMLGGCVVGGYSTWPPPTPVAPGTPEEFTAINLPPQHNVVTEALRWTARRYPPVPAPQPGVQYDQPFAINLPRGVTEEMYRLIAMRVSEHARPYSTQFTHGLPVYHISRVDVRGATADVEIIRPVLTIAPDGQGTLEQNLWQGVRLRLEGGLAPWRVAWHSTFPATPEALPPLHPVEEARPGP